MTVDLPGFEGARGLEGAPVQRGGVGLRERRSGVPAGVVVPFAGSVEPAGWLICDGRAISRTAFARLFAAISTSYGAGDGSTTFNIPNLKGRVPVGRDAAQTEFDVLGETGGAKTHALTEAQMPSHSHDDGTLSAASHSHSDGTLSASSGGSHSHTAAGQSSSFMGQNTNVDGLTQTNKTFDTALVSMNSAGSHTHDVTGSTGSTSPDVTGNTGSAGSGSAHQNLPPYQVLNFLIRI